MKGQLYDLCREIFINYVLFLYIKKYQIVCSGLCAQDKSIPMELKDIITTDLRTQEDNRSR
jgi:hypothetical protein